MVVKPSRGEVWHTDLEPVEGHEQGMARPCVVLSADIYNHGPSQMVCIAPITRTKRPIPLHVPIDPPEGGVTSPGVILCDQIRTVSVTRLGRWGDLDNETMDEVEDRVKIFLDLK